MHAYPQLVTVLVFPKLCKQPPTLVPIHFPINDNKLLLNTLIGQKRVFALNSNKKMNELSKVINMNLMVNEPKSELSKRSLYSKRRKKKSLKKWLIETKNWEKNYTQIQAVQVVNSFRSKILKCKELNDREIRKEAKKG